MLAATTLIPQHYAKVADRRISHFDRTLNAVHERLNVDEWDQRCALQYMNSDHSSALIGSALHAA